MNHSGYFLLSNVKRFSEITENSDSILLKIYFETEDFYQDKIPLVKSTKSFEEEVQSPDTQVLLQI